MKDYTKAIEEIIDAFAKDLELWRAIDTRKNDILMAIHAFELLAIIAEQLNKIAIILYKEE